MYGLNSCDQQVLPVTSRACSEVRAGDWLKFLMLAFLDPCQKLCNVVDYESMASLPTAKASIYESMVISGDLFSGFDREMRSSFLAEENESLVIIYYVSLTSSEAGNAHSD